VLLAAIGTVVYSQTRTGTPGLASVAPNAVGVIDPTTNRIVAQIPIGGGPARLAAGSGGAVWIGSDDSGTVSSLTPGTYESTKLVSIAGFPSDLAVGEGSVWVVDGRNGQLDKVDPVYGNVAARVQVTVRNPVYDVSRYAFDPVSVAAGGGSVWVTDGSETLVRVDPRATRVVDRIPLGDPLDGVAVGGGAVWAVSGPSATAIRLDRKGRETLRIPVVSGPGFESPYPLQVRVGEGYVWVLNGNTATVTKIDPGQRVVSANVAIGIGRGPARLAVGEGAAWVASADGTLARIDAATNDVAIFPVGHNLRDVAVGAGAVWVAGGSGLSSTAKPSDVVSDARVRPLPPSTCSPIYYEGPGSPDYLIASDLPLQGYGTATPQQSQAIQFILRKHRFQAGSHAIGYQSCDDSTISEGYDASARCAANARSYAANPSVIGVIGPFNSGCAIQEIPTLNRALGGPLAMISYSNTLLGLTQGGRGTVAGEPDVYYPTGTRNYARIIATDDLQAAADAVLARRLGARRIFVVNEQYDYGRVLSENFEAAAAKLGLKIVGGAIFFYGGSSYTDVVASMTRADPDAVFLAAPIGADSAELLAEIRSALPSVKIMATDGFAVFEQLRKLAGAAAEGMTVSLAGVPTTALRGPGKSFATEFGEQVGQDPDEWSVAAAQATEMLLEAIARSDGTRASVTAELGKSKVSNGILGSFKIDANGDTTAGAITIYRIVHGAPQVVTVITPSPSLVR
jgi:branched-chain amino acid transport system substrate-binding protein